MSNLSLLLNIGANVQGAAQVAQLQRALQALGATKISLGNPVAGLNSGVSAALPSVGKLTVALGGLYAAAKTLQAGVSGISAAFKKGLDANAAAESTQLGVKAIIASLYEVRTASGEVLRGQAAIAAAGGEAQKQLDLLRVAGMNTSAEFEDLAKAFQVALGAGASAGLSIDQIRDLTVKLTMAAGSFSLQKDQLTSEIRALLTGNEIDNSQIAQGLNISGAQIKLWRDQGKLADELNKRLETFAQLGDEAGKTWSATLSNINDGFTLFAKEATGGAFDSLKESLQNAFSAAIDPNTGKIQESFTGLAEAGRTVFTDIGEGLASALDGAVQLAQDFSGWLTDNKQIVNETWEAFKNVGAAIGDALGAIGKMVLGSTEAVVKTGFLKDTFNAIAIIIASITDGFKIVLGVVGTLGNSILMVVVEPLKFVAKIIDKLAGTNLAGYAEKVQQLALANGRIAAEMAKEGAERTTIKQTLKRIEDDKKAASLPQAEYSNEGRGKKPAPNNTFQPKPQAPKKDDAAAKAAKEAAAAAKAQADLEIAQAKSLTDALKAENDNQLALLDAKLQAKLVSQQDYLREKARLDNLEIDQEIEAARKAVASREREAAATRATEGKADDLKAEAEVVKAKSALATLEKKKLKLGIDLDAGLAEAARKLEQFKFDLKADLLDGEGKPLEATLERLARKYDDLRKNADYSGDADLMAMLDKRLAQEEQLAKLAEVNRLAGEEGQRQSLRESALQLDLNNGVLTGFEYEEALRASREQSVSVLEKQAAAMRAMLAIDPKNSTLQLGLAAMDDQIAKLKDRSGEFGAQFNRSVADAVANSLASFTSFKDFFKNVLSSILKDLQGRFTKQVGDSIFKALQGGASGKEGGAGSFDFSSFFGSLKSGFSSLASSLGGLFGGGSDGSFLSSLGSLFSGFQGFATGGAIRGPGTGTSDSILARLSNGEFVIKASSVNSLGADFLHYINANGKLPAFANGGLAGAAAGAGAGAGNTTLNLAPALYLDRDTAAAAVASSGNFRDAVIDIVVKNKRRING